MAPKIRGGFSPIGVWKNDVVPCPALDFGSSVVGQKQSLLSVCFQLSCSPKVGTREFESWTSIGCSLSQQRCFSARTRSARMPFAEATSMTRDRRQFRSPWSGCFQSWGCCSWVESCGRTTNDLHQLESTASTRFLTSLGRSTAREIINMAIRGPELRPAGAACHWPFAVLHRRQLSDIFDRWISRTRLTI